MRRACFYLTRFLFVMLAGIASVLAQEGAFPISSTPGVNHIASIASDGTNYFVVWENRQAPLPRVYGARVSPDGQILDPEGILIADPGQLLSNSSIAFDGENYLVVWNSYRLGESRYGIYATLLDGSGNILEPALEIAAPEPYQQGPSVAFNGTDYLVVWNKGVNEDSEILSARVSPDGTISDKISIARPDEVYRYVFIPQVASDREDFLVIWHAFNGAGQAYVRASRISAQGVVLDPDGITLARVPGGYYHTAVGFDGTNYMVAWVDPRLGNLDLFAARITAAGRVLDPEGIAIVTSPGAHYRPRVAFDGENYWVVWVEFRTKYNEVWGAHVTPEGEVLEPDGFPIFARPDHSFTEDVAFGMKSGLVVWENCSDFCRASEIYGKILKILR